MVRAANRVQIGRRIVCRGHFVRVTTALCIAALALTAVSACSGSSGSTTSDTKATNGSDAATPRTGGTLTVLLGPGAADFMSTLDPLGTNSHVYIDLTAAIYGQLFWRAADGSSSPGLATGYEFVDNKTVLIHLRKGVEFSDGTPFNAEAVKWNWDRSLKKNPDSPVPLKSVTVKNPHALTVNLKTPDAAFINELFGQPLNYIVSPTAFEKMGQKKFAKHPVGAGPFIPVSFTPNDKVVLKRNSTYWEEGHPYLDKLTFKAVGGAQAAYQAMLAGQGDAFQGLSDLRLLDTFKSKFVVTKQPSYQNQEILLNTSAPPFNNIKARKALYYAMNRGQLNKSLFGGKLAVTDSFQNNQSKFPMQKVPDYPKYNPEKAKELVNEVGKVEFTLWYGQGSNFEKTLATGLQKQFQDAGMKVRLENPSPTVMINSVEKGDWQAWIFRAGSYDPARWSIPLIYGSGAQFSGISDKVVDQLMASGRATLDKDKRADIYRRLVERITDKAYGPFLYQMARYSVATEKVHAPGLTTGIVSGNPSAVWQDAWVEK